MDFGVKAIWERAPVYLGDYYPVIVCLIGGLIIGMMSKRIGPYPEDLMQVIGKVRRDRRYDHRNLGKITAGAVLPLVFGGSVGPEAGLSGIVAALCTWVGDRLKRIGKDLGEMSALGMYATVSAIFTAPFLGMFLSAEKDAAQSGGPAKVSRAMRFAAGAAAAIGAVGAFYLLSHYLGGGLSLPYYSQMGHGADELLWMIPVALVAAFAGWLFLVFSAAFRSAADRFFGERPVLMCAVAGLVLGISGALLPFTMFAGETQAGELNEVWTGMSAGLLLATGFAKVAVSAMCVNMGWRGGHLFPLIFSAIAIGYGLSSVIGIDPTFCLCVCSAALMGAALRKPAMAIVLLFLCFPIQGAIIMAVPAVMGAYLPLPESVKRILSEKSRSKDGKDGSEGSI